MIDDALAWPDTVATQPFFLWVHLYDPHANQTLPDAYPRDSPETRTWARLHLRTHRWAAFSIVWTSVERQSWSR